MLPLIQIILTSLTLSCGLFVTNKEELPKVKEYNKVRNNPKKQNNESTSFLDHSPNSSEEELNAITETLQTAVRNNDLDQVKQSIQTIKIKNLNINLKFQDEDGNTIIHTTILQNNLPLLEELLTLKEIKQCIDITNKAGYTPLLLAASENDLDSVKKLLEHQANPNIPNSNGNTPLHAAAYNNNEAMVAELLKYRMMTKKLQLKKLKMIKS
jgi:ankyrin repeat protein